MASCRSLRPWLAALLLVPLLAGGLFQMPGPAGGVLAAGPALNDPRFDQTATLLTNGQVLVAGGELGRSGAGTATNSTELYNPATNDFTRGASMKSARTRFTATPLPDGRVLLAGGLVAGTQATDTAELLALA